MPFFLHDHENHFPSPARTRKDGLLAIGSNLHTDTLIKAYSIGTFPWFNEGDPIMWYHPDPRCILFPEKIKISHSMRSTLRNKNYSFTVNKAFYQTIKNCRITPRKGPTGESTWISDDIEKAYSALFEAGKALSAETWYNGELVGGLYGVHIGKVFFGESMFSKVNNASKYALINFCRHLISIDTKLIDCQIYTPHIESMGAELIPRKEFLNLLEKLIE